MMAVSGSNGGTGRRPVGRGREAAMAAFDALPPAVRSLLRDCPLNVDPVGVRLAVLRGSDADAIEVDLIFMAADAFGSQRRALWAMEGGDDD